MRPTIKTVVTAIKEEKIIHEERIIDGPLINKVTIKEEKAIKNGKRIVKEEPNR